MLFAVILLTILSDPLTFAPPITQDQESLVMELGHKNFRVREAASKKLADMDYSAIRAYHKAINSSDQEIVRRGEELLRKFYVYENVKLPGIHGFYAMKPFVLTSNKNVIIPRGLPLKLYIDAGGEITNDEQNINPNNECTHRATKIYIDTLRRWGYTKIEIAEILERASWNTDGETPGTIGWKYFRAMQDLPEYYPL